MSLCVGACTPPFEAACPPRDLVVVRSCLRNHLTAVKSQADPKPVREHSHPKCPLSGVKRTCLIAAQMSAFDPKRTFSPWRKCSDLHSIEHRGEPLGATCSGAVEGENRGSSGAPVGQRLAKRQPSACPLRASKNKSPPSPAN